MFSTGKIKQRYLPDWVILGDNSRTVFLRWLLAGAELKTDENSVIWIRYGIRLSITQQESHWIIETPVLLPRMTLYFPPKGGLDFSLDTSKRTKYAVLEAFPFRKQTSMDLIRRLESSGSEVLVVLMDLPRHQGSTDLIAPGGDVDEAMEAYRTECCDVSIMQNADNLQSILHWHRPMYDVWADKVRTYHADMYERISEIPLYYLYLIEDWETEDWMDNGGPLQVQTMDRLFSYQTAKREKGKNLWDCFAIASKRALFPASGQGPLTPVMELYKECLDNPLVFWSVDTDVEDFMNTLQHEFVKELECEESKGRYRERTQLPDRLDEDSYLRLFARNGDNGIALNAVFRRRIKDYLCDEVKGYLEERLKQRYHQLEGMIP